jgi:hypothetical protein
MLHFQPLDVLVACVHFEILDSQVRQLEVMGMDVTKHRFAGSIYFEWFFS